MAPFDKLFRRNSRQVDVAPPGTEGNEPAEQAASDAALKSEATPVDATPTASAPAPVPASGGAPPGPPPSGGPMAPGHNPAAGPGPGNPGYQQLGQNAGMLAGGALGAGDPGVGIGSGLVGGEVVGGMVGQRVDQHVKHQYWGNQAMQYREALAAGQPPLSAQVEAQQQAAGKQPSWWSREGRELRRLKRWERRAERRDGV